MHDCFERFEMNTFRATFWLDGNDDECSENKCLKRPSISLSQFNENLEVLK